MTKQVCGHCGRGEYTQEDEVCQVCGDILETEAVNRALAGMGALSPRARILKLANELRALFPDREESISMDTSALEVRVNVHGLPNYDAGVELLGRFGITPSYHHSYKPEAPWCSVSGVMKDSNIGLHCYCLGLAPDAIIVEEPGDEESGPRKRIVTK